MKYINKYLDGTLYPSRREDRDATVDLNACLILHREAPSSNAGHPDLRQLRGQHLDRDDW